MVQIPVAVSEGTRCIPDVPFCQFNATPSRALPGGRKRTSKNVNAVRLDPEMVMLKDIPAAILLGLNCKRAGRGYWPGELLMSIETVLERSLGTARSGSPSPLKSPTAADRGSL